MVGRQATGRRQAGMYVCMCVCACIHASVFVYIASTDRKTFLFFNIFLHQSTQLWWGPGIFWGANSLAIACQSAKGPGGTLGAHTHKLRV